MLHGVLNMPAELWDSSNPFDSMQRQSRYVEASKLIYQQADRIAELEKALQRQTKRVKLLEPFLESEPKSQDIRDLEQQALACDWIYTKLPDYSSVNLSVITARRLELITQANTLRGKSERLQSKG
jgi:hypothetical protein